MENIPFFDYPDVYTRYGLRFRELFDQISSRGSFIMQGELRDFEEKLAETSDCKYAVGVGNATDALEMLIEYAIAKRGLAHSQGKVLVCDHTMGATAASIARNGLEPLVVDFDDAHGMTLDRLSESEFENVVGIVPTQLNGRVCNMEPILEACTTRDLFLVEDSAQGLGACYKGRSAGSFGLGGCLSFYPAKVVGALGDAGAVITNDRDVRDWLRLARDHGRNPETGRIEFWGRNSRLDNIQAAFLCEVLDNYDQIQSRRRDVASLYCTELASVSEVVTPESPDDATVHHDIFQNFEIRAQSRDQLRSYLSDKGVGTLIQWGGVRISDVGATQKTSLPFSDSEFSKLLMLPLNLTITDAQVRLVVSHIKDFYGR